MIREEIKEMWMEDAKILSPKTVKQWLESQYPYKIDWKRIDVEKAIEDYQKYLKNVR